MLPFYVYILKCSDGSYYTGHTDDIDKRISEHKLGIIKCYTSTRLPVKVVFIQQEALIKGSWDEISLLSKRKTSFKK